MVSGGRFDVKGVTVLEVVTAPGVRRFRLAGELENSGVRRVVRSLRLDGGAGDVQLDVRALTSRDGSVILLFMHVAGLLGSGGRLYLRLADAIGLEDDLPNVRIVRHPSRPAAAGHRAE